MSTVLWVPNLGPQTAFLQATAREVLYGGAVAGGKTDALLLWQRRYADHPRHSGLVLRRTRKRLQEVIDRSRVLYPQIIPGAVWHETETRWRLPAGGSVYMGYAEHEQDIEAYKTFEFNLITFDELTEFTQYQYLFMLSRNRSKDAALLPLIRSATNPGGMGMQWVYERFIKDRDPYRVYAYEQYVEGIGKLLATRQFIPSSVFDNPRLANRDAYIAGLAAMGDEMANAMLYGRWDKFRGQYFTKLPEETEPGVKDMGNWYVIRAMDYGWSDPTCVLWLVVCPKLRTVEIAAELYGSQMTTDSIAHMIHETEKLHGWQGRVLFSVLSPDRFRQESDAAQNIPNLLARKGVWFERANNDRIAGWAQVQRLLSSGALKRWRGAAPELERTLLHLPRDPNKPNDIVQRGVEDHAAEALRYACMAHIEAGDVDASTHSQQPQQDDRWRDTHYDRMVEQWEQEQRGAREAVDFDGLGQW